MVALGRPCLKRSVSLLLRRETLAAWPYPQVRTYTLAGAVVFLPMVAVALYRVWKVYRVAYPRAEAGDKALSQALNATIENASLGQRRFRVAGLSCLSGFPDPKIEIRSALSAGCLTSRSSFSGRPSPIDPHLSDPRRGQRMEFCLNRGSNIWNTGALTTKDRHGRSESREKRVSVKGAD